MSARDLPVDQSNSSGVNEVKFGVYTEMNAMPGVDTSDSVWDVMRHIQQCDALGYDVFMVIEHYFFPGFGQSANPLAVFSAAAQLTENIRFRTLCHTLPLHEPTVLASEIATADVLTKGRLDLGFGRGHAWLYKMAGIPYEESAGRYDEATEIITRALTEDMFSFHGEKYQLDDVCISPRPVQKPMPPVFVTGTSARSFRDAAKRGWGIVVGGPAPYAVFQAGIESYREACKDAGTTPKIGYIQPMHIDEDGNRAEAKAREAAAYFYHQIGKPIESIDQVADHDRLVAAGYGFYAGDGMNQMLTITAEQIEEMGLLWAGTPAQIRNRMIDFLDLEPVDEYSIQTLPRAPEVGATFEDQKQTQRLFAEKVMPEFG